MTQRTKTVDLINALDKLRRKKVALLDDRTKIDKELQLVLKEIEEISKELSSC